MKPMSIMWNLVGLGIPIVFALVAIPLLVDRLGVERFGMLALAWALLGYSSVFDLGIGRATTQYLSEIRGLGMLGVADQVLRTAVKTTVQISLFGMCGLLAVAVLGIHKGIEASPEVIGEVGISVYLMCLILPLQAVSSTYRGVSEAFEKFRAISVVRAVQGAANFAGPVAVSLITVKLQWIVMTLFVSRLIGVGMYRFLGWRAIRSAARDTTNVAADTCAIRRRLLHFGGWATVSGVVSPVMVQADRFFIAGILSAAAVTAYALPFEIVSQSLIVVGAVTTVAFPALSRLATERPSEMGATVSRWAVRTGIAMVILASGIAASLPIMLPLWLGREVSTESILAGQVLCAGVAANSVGSMYYAGLHALGKSAITARIHLMEVPVYLAALVLLLQTYGIVGAAMAWSGRMILDALLLRRHYRNLDV